MQRIVKFNVNRSEYDIRYAADNSLTVGELIEELQENYNAHDKIVFSNDNGYTYGYVTAGYIDVEKVQTREEEKMEELIGKLCDLECDYAHVPDPDDDFDEEMTEEEYLESRAELFKEYGVTEEEYLEYVNTHSE